MNFPIDINAGQFLAFAALAVAVGVAFGIAIGIKLYEKHLAATRKGKSEKVECTRPSPASLVPRLSSLLEAR